MSTATVEQITAISEMDDHRSAYNAMRRLMGERPESDLGGLLWKALETEEINLGGYPFTAWRTMASAPQAYDGALFLKLLDMLATWELAQSPPGWFYGPRLGWPIRLEDLLEAKEGDAQFFETLVGGWRAIPSPCGEALAMHLVKYGFLDPRELPDEFLEEAAKFFIERTTSQGFSSPPFGRQQSEEGNGAAINPFPPAMWAQRVLKYALRDQAERIDASVLEFVAGTASPEEITSLISKVASRYSVDYLISIDAIAGYGEAILAPLKRAVLALDQGSDDKELNLPPAILSILSYLEVCHRVGKPPGEEVDLVIERFFQVYNPNWGGAGFDESHQMMREKLQAIPLERLEAIILRCKPAPLLFAAAAPTETVCRRVVEEIRSTKSERNRRYDFGRDRGRVLRTLAPKVVPVLCEAVVEECLYHREEMIAALGDIGDDRAVPALAALLSDRRKGFRQAAKTALIRMSTEAILDHIEDALGGSRKDGRIAAAEILRLLEPTKRGYNLAVDYLQREKRADVRAILEGVEKPGGEEDIPTVGDQRRREILEALEKSAGNAWQQFIEEGDALVEIYLEFLYGAYHGTSFPVHYGRKGEIVGNLMGLAGALSESKVMRQALVDLAGASSRYGCHEFFDRVAAVVPDFPIDLAEAALKKKIHRPPEFGPTPTYHRSATYAHAFEWLMEKHPEHAWKLAMAGLKDGGKAIREQSVARILTEPERIDVEGDILPLLDARRKEIRQSGVEVLAGLGDRAYLPHLKQKLEKERANDVRAAIEEAIVRFSAQDLDVSDFADDAQGHLSLDHRLSQMPATQLPKFVKLGWPHFPKLQWKSGAELSKPASRWFVGEVLAQSRDYQSQKVYEVRARIDDESCAAFCAALLKMEGLEKPNWALYMHAILASPAQLDALGEQLDAFGASSRHGWGEYAVDVFVRVGTNQAVRILDDRARRSRRRALKKRAKEGVRRIAEARGVSVDELLESATGTFGFDRSGIRVFDYGSREVMVRLLSDGKLAFEDPDGTRFASTPQGRKTDDPDLVRQARQEISRIRRQIKRIRKAQVRRLEAAMVAGRRWSPAIWQERYVEHPIMRSVAAGLVWGVYDAEEGELIRTLLIDDDGLPVDLNYETITFDDGGERVGLVHPLEIGDAKAQWLDLLVDYERVQPFKQLQRRVFTIEEIGNVALYLLTFQPVEPAKLFGRLKKLGYEMGPRLDGGLSYSSTRNLGRWSIEIDHDGLAPGDLAWSKSAAIQGLSLSYEGEECSVNDAPALIYSEIVHDISVLMG